MADHLTQKSHIFTNTFFPIKETINILIVEDNRSVANIIESSLNSPFLNITTANSLQDARKKIKEAEKPWSCWIIDIDLGDSESGISLIEEFNKFQFSVVLSGMKNMSLGFEAAQKGALKVYDKIPKVITTQFIEDVYRIAVLGYLLRGRRTDYLNIFLLLQSSIITSPKEWAENAFIGLRHLENLCVLHTGLTPRQVISFYYYICVLLYGEKDEFGNILVRKDEWRAHFGIEYHFSLERLIEFALTNFNTIYQRFSTADYS